MSQQYTKGVPTDSDPTLAADSDLYIPTQKAVKAYVEQRYLATGGGTVGSVAVVSANGFAGTVANPNTTPSITLSTTITGLLKGSTGALTAASAGTDYLAPAAIGTTVQAYDADLSAIAALAGTTGLLKKTAADTWTLDTTAYTTNLGTVTSVSGTGTVNGLTLTGTVTSSGSLTLGGTLDLSSPPAIGGTAPAAGNFTTLGATGNVTLGDESTDTLTINGTAVAIPNGLNFDSNTLFIDAANNRVGIGTNAPASALEVRTAATTLLQVVYTGNSNLQLSAQASGESRIAATGTNGFLTLYTGSSSAERLRIDSAGSFLLRQSSNAANTSVSFDTTVQNALTLDSSGNVGIGAASSGAQLYIKTVTAGSVASSIKLLNASDADGTGTSIEFSSSGAGTLTGGIIAQRDGSGLHSLRLKTFRSGVLQECFAITSNGSKFLVQPAPAAVNATATLTVANLQTRIITSTTAAAVTGTLPTGTLMDGWYAGNTDMSVDWSVINTGATNTFTVAAGTAHTVVGNMVVAVSSSALFRSRRTAANTWVTYRVG